MDAKRLHGLSVQSIAKDYESYQTPRRLRTKAKIFYAEEASACIVELEVANHAVRYYQMDIDRMAFPFVFFLGCVVLAIIFQLCKFLFVRGACRLGASCMTPSNFRPITLCLLQFTKVTSKERPERAEAGLC